MATKTIKIADKPTLDEIKSLLSDDKHGLVVLQDSINSESMRSSISVTLLKTEYKKLWESVSTLPYRLYNGSAVVYNNEIHILGGYSNARYHYKWDGSSWTNVSTLPIGLNYGCAVVYNNEIHILGTYANSESYYAHCKWDGSSWTSVSTTPITFHHGSAVIYNDEIHVLISTSDYKWDGSSWTNVSTLPYNFNEGSAVVYNDAIHILGSGLGDKANGVKHYALLPVKTITMHLPKDSKIYTPVDLAAVTNCTFDTDHLVVSDDGAVQFKVETLNTSSIFTIIN